MRLTFSGEVIHWRGPAPHHWVTVSYGWDRIAVELDLEVAE